MTAESAALLLIFLAGLCWLGWKSMRNQPPPPPEVPELQEEKPPPIKPGRRFAGGLAGFLLGVVASVAGGLTLDALGIYLDPRAWTYTIIGATLAGTHRPAVFLDPLVRAWRRLHAEQQTTYPRE